MCITNKKKRLIIPWVWDPVCNFFALKDLLDQKRCYLEYYHSG